MTKTPVVVDLLSSSEDEAEERKMPAIARKRAASQQAEVVELLSSDEEGDEESDSAVKEAAISRTKKPKSPKRSNNAQREDKPSNGQNRGQIRRGGNTGKTTNKALTKIAWNSTAAANANQQLDETARDAEVARKFQIFEDLKSKRERERKEKQEEKDASLAASLFSKEEKARDTRKLQELDSMTKSNAGRSVLLVEQVIKISEASAIDGIEPVGKDDAVFLAEKLLDCQDQFRADGKPTHVCVGFHYTHSAHLQNIREDGLLTIDDRLAKNSKNKRNSAYFGNGIYTANNPHGFTQYGDCGLLLACLKGNVERIHRSSGRDGSLADTFVGNKLSLQQKKQGPPFYDEIILQKSTQVLPLVKFQQSKMNEKAYADLIWSLHQAIQHQVLDKYFNGSEHTPLTRIELK